MSRIANRYGALVSERRFESEPAQAQLVAKLDALAHKLRDYKSEAKPIGLLRLFGAKSADPPPGLYIHGPVGRGKTMLMDMFFDTVEGPRHADHRPCPGLLHVRHHRQAQGRHPR